MGHFVAAAKVLERVECSLLMSRHSQVFAVTLVTRYSQVFGAVSELVAMYSMVAVVEILKGAAASLSVVRAGVELVEPKVAECGPDVGPGVAPGPKCSCGADHVLEVAEAMKVGAGPGQVLVPMDSNWLEAVFEVVVELLASKGAELGLEFVMGAMHSLKVAEAVESELRPKAVEVDLELGPVAMSVAVPDAVVVVAEPTLVVAGILAEPAEPKEVVLGMVSGVVAPMVAEVESLFGMAVAMGSGAVAALVLELDPRLAAFAVGGPAHLVVSRVAEPVAGTVVVLETEPR